VQTLAQGYWLGERANNQAGHGQAYRPVDVTFMKLFRGGISEEAVSVTEMLQISRLPEERHRRDNQPVTGGQVARGRLGTSAVRRPNI